MQGTYEGHGVTCAGHDRLHHVHEHGQGKQDGDACKKSPRIKEENLGLLEYSNRDVYFYLNAVFVSSKIYCK